MATRWVQSPDFIDIEGLLDAGRKGEHSVGVEFQNLFEPALYRRTIRVNLQLEQMHQHLNETDRNNAYSALTPRLRSLPPNWRRLVYCHRAAMIEGRRIAAGSIRRSQGRGRWVLSCLTRSYQYKVVQ